MSDSNVQVGLVQMRSTAEVERNLAVAEREVRAAAGAGSTWILLPENFAYLRSEGEPLAFTDPIPGRLSAWGGELARSLGIWFTMGSFPEAVRGSRKARNTSLTFSPEGRRVARYRKLHLFDIDLDDGTTFTESKTIAAGEAPVWFDAPWGRTGVTICYDLRFPELYRRLAFAGCRVLCVPSAFTATTGEAHWLTLLRARAIENLAWVVAPAQAGRHSEARVSFGHSVVIDPWGRVVALKRRGVGHISAILDPKETDRVRRGLPALRHVRNDLWKGVRRRRDL